MVIEIISALFGNSLLILTGSLANIVLHSPTEKGLEYRTARIRQDDYG